MTDRYAVFGNPIAHSRSPQIHRAFAEQTGQDIAYDAIEAPKDGFTPAVRAFVAGGARGANVTVPFKLEAFALADERRLQAETAGAANCLKFEHGRIIAENFDGAGLVNDIERNLHYPVADRTVLIVGAGGAARGAVLPLLQRRPARLAVANRTADKARELATFFARHGQVEAFGLDELGADAWDLVINATSAGLHGRGPRLPASIFHDASLAYEMVYGKGLTPFLRAARLAGAHRLCDGVGMLVEQAAEAFAWWRGVRPLTGPVIAALSVPLE